MAAADDGTRVRTALCTGVLGGIGRAIVTVLRRRGYFVVGMDVAEGTSDCDLLLHCNICDFHDDPAKLAPIVAQVKDAIGGRLDLLVNNAAHQVVKPFEELTTTDWDLTINTNVTSGFLLIQAFLEDLKAARGSVVNVSSIHANLTKPGFVAYATSKGALVSLTRALAVELGPCGVRVNAVLPAATSTPMLVQGFKDNPEGFRELAAHHPVGRIAEPSEIAEFITFLASDSARFITGSELQIDGGIGGRLHDPV